MTRFTTLTAAMLALAAPAFAGPGHDEMAVGMPGDAAHVDRTVEVSMIETETGEMLYEPRDLSFSKGETVRFVITNDGEQEHEFVLDTPEENQEHKALMERVSRDGARRSERGAAGAGRDRARSSGPSRTTARSSSRA